MDKLIETQKNKLYYALYSEACVTMIAREQKTRHQAIRQYQIFLYTTEQALRILMPNFNIKEDLGLYIRGLSYEALGYVLTLDYEERQEQFNFYDTRRKAYEDWLNKNTIKF